jgi:hypothetical protein
MLKQFRRSRDNVAARPTKSLCSAPKRKTKGDADDLLEFHVSLPLLRVALPEGRTGREAVIVVSESRVKRLW